MKFNIAIAVFLSAAFAQPYRHHKHQNLHVKRDIHWVTDIEWVTTTVDVTTTIWVDPNLTSALASTLPTPTATPSRDPPAQFHETIPQPSPLTSTTSSSSSSAYVAAVQPSPYVAPYVAPVVAPVVAIQPASTSSTTPVLAPSPQYTAPIPTTTAAAALSLPSAAPPSGYNGECAAGSPCTGDITYYDTGMGACGWNSDGLNEAVVALPAALMGPLSNNNPLCGLYVTLKRGSAQVVAKVVDKCPGCHGHAIDLSRKAFDALCDEGVGRTTAEWWFN